MNFKKLKIRNNFYYASIISLLVITFIKFEAVAQTSKSNQNLNINPTIGIRPQKEIKIFMADVSSGPMSESTMLYPPNEWYLSKYDGAKSVDSLLKDGWYLMQIVPINAKQYYWVLHDS